MRVADVVGRGGRLLVTMARDLGQALSDQERALDNARRATTALSRKRVERDEVDLYLEDLEAAAQEAVDAATAQDWPDASVRAVD